MATFLLSVFDSSYNGLANVLVVTLSGRFWPVNIDARANIIIDLFTNDPGYDWQKRRGVRRPRVRVYNCVLLISTALSCAFV